MTNSSLVNSFLATFDVKQIISDSIVWQRDKRPALKSDLESIVQALKNGGLSRSDRSLMVQERDNLEDRIVFDDPAYISNNNFDDWCGKNGLTISHLSAHDIRNVNKIRMTNALQEQGYEVVLTSRGYRRGGMFIVDKLMWVIERCENFHTDTSEALENASEQLRKDLTDAGESYKLPDLFTVRAADRIETMAGRQRKEDYDHERLVKLIEENKELLEVEQKKLIIEQKELGMVG